MSICTEHINVKNSESEVTSYSHKTEQVAIRQLFESRDSKLHLFSENYMSDT